MKKESTKKSKPTQNKDGWVNVHDDKLMQSMGLMRYSAQTPRDPSVWSKTRNEKKLLKNAKYSHKKEDMHFGISPEEQSSFVAKLIIQLKPNKVFPKSTYSYVCPNTAVNTILNQFLIRDSKSGHAISTVLKYFYNGKTHIL